MVDQQASVQQQQQAEWILQMADTTPPSQNMETEPTNENMAHPSQSKTIHKVSYKDMRAKLGGAPAMHPRPTATNICAFRNHMRNKLTVILLL